MEKRNGKYESIPLKIVFQSRLLRARKRLNEEEAQMLQLPKNADLFVYNYAIAAKARIDDNDDDKEFMKKLRQLLIAFKKHHRNKREMEKRW